MKTMPISRFKATCLATLERVRRTARPVRITRFGKPVADIVPPTAAPAAKSWLGSMRGTAKIVGDITQPSGEPAAPARRWSGAGTCSGKPGLSRRNVRS